MAGGLLTLKNTRQFERVRQEGRTWAAPLLILNAAPNGLDVVRCGFVAGKKTGKAVERNRARRLMREAVRLRLPSIRPGWDLVWIARPAILEASSGDVGRDVDELLRRSNLLESREREHEHHEHNHHATHTELNEEHGP